MNVLLSPTVIKTYRTVGTPKAHYLLKQNVDTLLKARRQKRKELAKYCRRSESWLSQILRRPDRNLPLKYLDRMADFFGLAAYQLFQPGISPLTERRSGRDRRSGIERRISRVQEMLQPVPSLEDLTKELRTMSPEQYRVWAHRLRAASTLAGQGLSAEAPPDHLSKDKPRVARSLNTATKPVGKRADAP